MQPVPQGSKIRTDFDAGAEKLILPHPPGSNAFIKYIMGLSGVVWVVIYTIMSLKIIVPQIADGKIETVIIVIWATIGIFGAAYAISISYRALRPAIPEALLLTRPDIAYDSGIPPLRMPRKRLSYGEMWRWIFPQRCRIEITPAQLATLQLHQYPGGSRLTVDIDGKPLEIGTGLTDIDREWLHTTLQEH